MLPKKGMLLHPWSGLTQSPKAYAELIADALRQEHDGTHRTVKTIIRWTGASERSVKNWLSGECGPGGCYLMRLFVKSDAVRALVLDLMAEVEVAIPTLKSRDTDTEVFTKSRVDQSPSSSNMDASDGDRVGDINFVTNSVTDLISLNERQQWLMIRVATGVRCTARDLASHWQVSNRTAKRDIAYLKALGIIQYHGQHRKGRYVEARGS